jgi:uncharacterized membrane protein (UPF0127 family)
MSLTATNLDTGALVADKVSVAATRVTRAVGLLSRTSLDPGEALWIVPSRGVHTWGMRFTIDVLALDDRGVVVDRVSRLRPWRIRLPRRGTAGVLELPPGTLDASGTAIGHRIAFETRGNTPDDDPLFDGDHYTAAGHAPAQRGQHS